MGRYLLYRVVAWAAPHVPFRAGYRVFALIGDLMHLGAPRLRAQVRQNLAAAAPPGTTGAELRRMTRLAFRNLAWSYFELFHLPGTTVEWLRTHGRVSGLEHVIGRPDGAPGSVVVFPHSGNPEVLAQLPVLYPDERFVVVVGLMDNERVYRLMRDLRMSLGGHTVATDEPLRVWRRLKDGWHVIVAGDYDSTGTGVEMEMLGRRAVVPRGAVTLSLLVGAPLVTVESWRTSFDEPWRFEARVTPLQLCGSPRRRQDVLDGVEKVVGVLEETFRARPEQWLAFRKVFTEVSA